MWPTSFLDVCPRIYNSISNWFIVLGCLDDPVLQSSSNGAAEGNKKSLRFRMLSADIEGLNYIEEDLSVILTGDRISTGLCHTGIEGS